MWNYKRIYDALRGYNNQDLLFIDDREERLKIIKTHPFYQNKLAEIKKMRAQFLNEPIETINFSIYRIYSETGSRKEYNKVFFKRRLRMEVFAIMCLLEDNEEDIRALEDIIFEICNEYTWALPPHIRSLVKKDNYSPTTELDLINCETAFSLSEICYLLEHKLSPDIILRVREEVFRRVLNPFMEFRRLNGWEAVDSNWGAVCAGSIGATAIYQIKDNETLTPIILKVLGTMESYLEGFEEDGACKEGLVYWFFGFGFYVCFAELLRRRTNYKIDILHHQAKLQNVAQYLQKCFLIDNAVVSFSDTILFGTHQIGLTHFLAQNYEGIEVLSSKYQIGIMDDGCYRWCNLIRDFVWTNPDLEEQPFMVANYLLNQSQIVISKKLVKGKRVAFAVKGGNNWEPHNHNDISSFILNIEGESLLNDLGSGEYTKAYFGPTRYDTFPCGSLAHNIPIVNGALQKVGAQYRAENFYSLETADYVEAGMDISKTFGLPTLTKLQRTFRFNNDVVLLTLRDDYEFTEPCNFIERFVSIYEIEILPDKSVIVYGEKGKLRIDYDKTYFTPSISTEYFIDHGLVEHRVRVLDFTFNKQVEKISVVFNFVMLE